MAERRIIPPAEAREWLEDNGPFPLRPGMLNLLHTAVVLGEEVETLRVKVAEQEAALAALARRPETELLDPAKVAHEHRNIGPHWAGNWVCAAGCASDGAHPCQTYRLAKLAKEQANVLARVEVATDRISDMAGIATPTGIQLVLRAALAGEQS
jgi:hypothetical protein